MVHRRCDRQPLGRCALNGRHHRVAQHRLKVPRLHLPVRPLLGLGRTGMVKASEVHGHLSHAADRQVPGNPRRGVAQAWGDLMQVGTVIVVGL